MKKDYTHIGLLIDRSGSMSSIAKDLDWSIKTFLKEQSELEGQCTVSMAIFDSEYEHTVKFKDIKEFVPTSIVPRGVTALYDAIGKFTAEIGETLAALPEDSKPSKVLIIIVTDGEENASKEFSAENIKEIIKTQESVYSWNFTYLGANQDAVLAGSKFGTRVSNTLDYEANERGVKAAFVTLSAATANYRTDTSKGSSFTY